MHVGNGHLSYNQHGELLASVATLLGRWWSFDYTLPTVRCTCAVRSGTHVCKTIYVGAERERGDITWYYACSGCIIRPDHRGFEDQAIRVCLFRFFFCFSDESSSSCVITFQNVQFTPPYSPHLLYTQHVVQKSKFCSNTFKISLNSALSI